MIACDLFNREKNFCKARNSFEANWLSKRISSASAPCRCRLPSTCHCGGCAMVPPPPPSPPPFHPHHPSIPTTTSAPTIASMLRPPRLNYRLHLEPGAHTLAFDTSVTHLILAVIHAPVAAKSIYQAGWISKRVFFRASFCMKRWFGRETYGHLSFIVYWLCSVSSAFRILRSPLMSPFFPLVILYFYSQAFFNTWFCFVI